MIKKNAWPVAALVFAALAGCGGGGGSDNGNAPVVSALAGGWVGSASSGDTTQAVVLEDGTLYAINGSSVGGLLYIDSFDKATLRLSGNAVSAPNLREYSFPEGTFIAGTIAGTFTAGSSLNFKATANGGQSAQVNLQPAPRTNYNYDTPATLAAVQGNWPGNFSTGDSGTIAVSANGSFSATTALGCQLSGSIQPRASGKNVFDVSVQFGVSPCVLPGATVTGHGFVTHPDSGGTQLAVAVTTSDGSLGAAFFSTR